MSEKKRRFTIDLTLAAAAKVDRLCERLGINKVEINARYTGRPKWM